MAMAQSRTQKSLRNARVALLFYCLNLILQFFSRKIFLDYLGSEILGLNTTAQNLLGLLNLAELGIGTAVAYNLYKPLLRDNRKEINDIVSVQGWLYRRIALIVSGCALVLMYFFPLLFGDKNFPIWYAYGSFLVLLFSSLLGYFVNYRQILLSADQKEYKVTYSNQGVKVIKVILQIFAISYLPQGYLWWMVLEVLCAVTASIVLNVVIKKEYPWLAPRISDGRMLIKSYPQILTKTKQLFFHKIGQYVLTQTSPLIIYAYSSLTMVAIYGNYVLITSGVQALVNALLNGISAGVGNLVAEGNQERIKSFFWELTALRIWIASIICFSIYMLADSFITLWVGNEFLMSRSALIVLVLITFIQLTRTNDIFLSAYGLFEDIWAPVAEASLNIGLSILLGHFFGLTGILTGVLVSLLVVVCSWKPYFLYKRGFKESPVEYLRRYFKYVTLLGIVSVVCVFFIMRLISLQVDSWINWIIYAVLVVSIFGIVSFILLYLFDKPYKKSINRFLIIIGHNLSKI